ncbi:xylulokinase [Boudabousia liubingyangii]|uniref:xylulokinase n=1 Tax=Boudabousia liubingyangii TaxID=1921764 RepID=UPI00093A7582|nr:xylulokinase [Boudabousia liubingyangii]OKL47453.1 xylulokinase [Boudabousia liubingyangii]
MTKYVAGIDSSTQSVKVLVCDPNSGKIVRQASAKHPDGTEVDPQAWLDALEQALSEVGGLDDCLAVSVAGQQHGMVLLDEKGEVIRPALLWNDTRSAKAAEDLIEELGNGDVEAGKEAWAKATGSVPVASFTATKLRWVADNEPENAARIRAICLPHDWLSWKLSGSEDLNTLTTDRSDASGTAYFDLSGDHYRYDLLALALKIDEEAAKEIILPRVLAPSESTQTVSEKYTKSEVKIGPGCGDNAGAALGLGLEPGVASVSLGTSGVVAAVSSQPVSDPSGLVAGFQDATGNWLPLACTLNASRIVDVVARMMQVDYRTFDELALKAEPGAGGITLTPYFAGERTPNLPEATASFTGMNMENTTPENLARATCEGLCALMRYALDAMNEVGAGIEQAVLIGGGAKSTAVTEFISPILGVPVTAPEPGEYVALGAARQAAWVALGELPEWTTDAAELPRKGDYTETLERARNRALDY